jgi:polysaccharide deacetylase family sporulation protein PdaB
MSKVRIFLVRPKKILFVAVIIAVIGGIVFFRGEDAQRLVSAVAPKKDLPIYCVQTEDKVASLSFDAAWGNEDTEQLIDILAKYNVKATFFVVGQWVDKYPESVKQLSDAGHEVMNHSNTHPHLPQLSREQIIKEIQSCDQKIESVTGKKPFLTRPPYGDYNDTVVGTLREIGHYTIQWDVDSLDWKDLSAQEIYNRVTQKAQNGSIVLFHNAAKNTPNALPMIIESLQAKGYELVPISELIYTENYEINHEGRQIPKE